MNTRTFKIDGSKGRWPARLNDVEVTVPAPEPFTAVPSELTHCFESVEALNDFLHTGVYNAILGVLARELKSGSLEKADADAVKAAAATLKVTPAQRRTSTKKAAAVDAAERRAAAAEEAAEATRMALVAALKELPAKARDAQVTALKAAGVLPADFTL